MKGDFMKEKAKLRNMNSVSFVDAPAHNVYLNEHLTASNRKKFAEARKQRDDGNFKFVWVKNGHIYIREEEGKPAVLYNEGKKWKVNRSENANGFVVAKKIRILLPKNTHESHVNELKKLSFYYDEKTSQTVVEAEYLLGSEKWKGNKQSDIPNGIVYTMDACNKRYLLCVLAALPMSVAEVERSFSSLKKVKTYLRNSDVH
uniref:FP protein C-terminal domain-containing protein n=1 Tax=Timema genevievae TaxID=629358 RepID=A0A7R9JYP3_TIMGE|nr:unnamed protein product [Timema genevievae]